VFGSYLKEMIYGGVDGIITTFAVVAGFAGAALSSETTTQLSFLVVLLFGLANLFADAASMGLGNLLSVRSEKELYAAARRCEQGAIEKDPATAQAETIAILSKEGFSTEAASDLAKTYQQNTEYWLNFLMRHKRDMADPRGDNEFFTGLATFVSFLVFGTIPLLPFLLQKSGDPGTAFFYSCVGTLLALVVLGLLKWRIIRTRLIPSLLEVVLVGGTAAVLAYAVGTFFAL
jgi:VIT1/CCC1 family predicted Fe2+/Mn2+ transporter